MDAIAIMGLGLGLGFLHAFDADHLAAVSAFVSKRPAAKACVRFALAWGAGHSVSLWVLSAAVLLLGQKIGAGAEHALEKIVGLAMIGLGIWRLADFLQGRMCIHSHAHEASRGGEDHHDHYHIHAHANGDDHDHSHVAGFMGLLHGAAGSARFLVLIPVALIGSWSGCVSYILFFCVGMTAAMIVYAVSLGRALENSQRRFVLMQYVYQPLTALTSIGVGAYWVAAGV